MLRYLLTSNVFLLATNVKLDVNLNELKWNVMSYVIKWSLVLSVSWM